MRTKQLNIILSTDENYLIPTLLTAWSIYINNHNSKFFILCSFDHKNYDHILEKLDSEFSSRINYTNLDEFSEILLKLPGSDNSIKHISNMAYARLFAPNIFNEIDYAYYFDSDVIVRGDITKIFNKVTKDVEFTIAGSKNYFIAPVTWTRIYSKYSMSKSEIENVINSGAIIMNFKKLREIDFSNAAIKWLEDTKESWMDQAAINYILRGKITHISPKYNWGVHRYETFRSKYPFTKPLILHYASQNKPWNSITKYSNVFNKTLDSFRRGNPNIYEYTFDLSFLKRDSKDYFLTRKMYISEKDFIDTRKISNSEYVYINNKHLSKHKNFYELKEQID